MSTATSTTILPPEEGSLIASKALIHLRLLFAFRKLRMQIGSQDGLWGIWDDRLETHHLSPDEREQGLAKLKEKRWSIYLARAVHRYSAWWAAMGPSPLTEQDTMAANSTKYATFTTSSPRKEWTLGSMIPLGALDQNMLKAPPIALTGSDS